MKPWGPWNWFQISTEHVPEEAMPEGMVPAAFDIDEYANEGIAKLGELLRRWAEFQIFVLEHDEETA